MIRMKDLDQFKRVECTCGKCIGYCEKTPGWFRPEEISPLAKFLEMSIEEVFKKHLIADFWITDSGRIYVLSPMKDAERLLSSHDPLRREIAKFYLESRKFLGEDEDRAGGFASFSYAFFNDKAESSIILCNLLRFYLKFLEINSDKKGFSSKN